MHSHSSSSIRPQVTEVCPRTFFLDSRRLNPFGFSGVYLLVDDGITLIETATSLVAPAVIEAVRDLGFQEQDIHSAFDIFKTESDLDWAAQATLRSFVLGYHSYFARAPE